MYADPVNIVECRLQALRLEKSRLERRPGKRHPKLRAIDIRMAELEWVIKTLKGGN
jgi:hypothetical protein